MFVGIDVSKDRLDVAVHGGTEKWQFGRDEKGISQLIEQLRGLPGPIELVVLEATGDSNATGAFTSVAAPCTSSQAILLVELQTVDRLMPRIWRSHSPT